MNAQERIVDALERIADAVEALAGKQRLPVTPLAPVDEDRLAALLPPAFDRVKGQPWKAGDLAKGLVRFGATDRALVVALDAIDGSLGKFLKRCDGREAGGFRLDLVGRDGNQNVWRIRPTGANLPRPPFDVP